MVDGGGEDATIESFCGLQLTAVQREAGLTFQVPTQAACWRCCPGEISAEVNCLVDSINHSTSRVETSDN